MGSTDSIWMPPMAISEDERAFFVRVGAAIAERRKQQGLTQVQLSAMLGLSQQTLNAYEVGRRRISVPVLATVARNLGTSIEELIGEQGSTAARKRRGPEPKLARQIEQVRQLPRAQQQFVSQMIDTVLQQQHGQDNARQKTGS